jgi:hypothetical protein
MLAGVMMLSITGSARADDERVEPDPRYLDSTSATEGSPRMLLSSKQPSTALAYFAVVGAALLVVGVLFKGSGRTHLD